MRQVIRIPIRQLEIPENPYGYVYLTVDLLKNKKYIGKHKAIEFDTKYFGSNLRIERILKKRPETLYCMILEWAETEEQLNELEKYWIVYFDAVKSEDFYNIMAGGDGGALSGDALERMRQSKIGKSSWNKGVPCKESTKEKIRQFNLGRKASEETRKKMSLRAKLFRHTEESKEKLRQAHLGMTLSEETKAKISEHRKGKMSGINHWNYGNTMTEEQKKHLSEINTGSGSPVAKSVYAFNLSGRLIKVCETRAKAAKEFELTASKVSLLCCKNDRDENVTYHCNGYVFSGNLEYQIKPSVEESKVVKPGEKRRLSQVHKDRIAQKSKLFRHTEESKEKLRQAHLGSTLSEETRAKISEHRKGKLTGEDNPNYGGKAMSFEQRKTHSEFMKGKRMSPKTEFNSENSSGGNNSQAKAVVQLTENGELVKEYSYVGEVNFYGFNDEGVRKCCKGKQLKYKGYRWMYKDDYVKEHSTLD